MESANIAFNFFATKIEFKIVSTIPIVEVIGQGFDASLNNFYVKIQCTEARSLSDENSLKLFFHRLSLAQFYMVSGRFELIKDNASEEGFRQVIVYNPNIVLKREGEFEREDLRRMYASMLDDDFIYIKKDEEREKFYRHYFSSGNCLCLEEVNV